MNILYVITGLGMGGAEKQLAAVVRCMAKHHEVRVCYLTGEPTLINDFSGVEVIPLEIKKTSWSLVRGYFRLRSLILDFKPDIVHSHMVHANILCRMMRLSIGIPMLVCSAHSTHEGGVLRMLAYRLTDKLAHVTTNVSLEAVQAFERVRASPVGKMKVVFNGVDAFTLKFDHVKRKHIRSLANVKETDRIILSVGRLVKAKDFSNLLNAFAMLSKSDQSLRLWIVGEGSERPTLTARVKELGIVENVTFWGARSDVDAFYNAADMYVLSSAWEGFPLVVSEAMATELVVVATDCGGVRELFENHEFLVPVNNPELLAQAIERVLGLSKSCRKEMGRKNRARVVDFFSLEHVVLTWLKIYKSR